MKNAAGAWVNARVTDAGEGQARLLCRAGQPRACIDKEYVTNKFDVKEDKFYTGKAGVIFGSSAEVADIYGGKMARPIRAKT